MNVLQNAKKKKKKKNQDKNDVEENHYKIMQNSCKTSIKQCKTTCAIKNFCFFVKQQRK